MDLPVVVPIQRLSALDGATVEVVVNDGEMFPGVLTVGSKKIFLWDGQSEREIPMDDIAGMKVI